MPAGGPKSSSRTSNTATASPRRKAPGRGGRAISLALSRVPPSVAVGIAVLVVVALAAAIASIVTWKETRLPRSVCAGARSVMQRAAQWSTQAEQDQHPLLRLAHVNYAIAHLNALRTLVSDSDIEKLTHRKPREVIASLLQQQAEAVRKVTRDAPSLRLKAHLGSVAGWR